GGDTAGVPLRVIVDGLAPGELDATRFRHLVGRSLGWHVLKSHTWQVSRTARGYRFTGRGKGHGAGLCLRGAAALANGGRALPAILAAYLPGARLRALDDTITLRLPAEQSATAGALRDDARTALAELRYRVGAWPPARIAIVVHPTVQAYQRATGRAWWTAAHTRVLGAGRFAIDLAPARDQAARAATLRHEFVHVLTAVALQDTPAWTREGLAHWLAHATGPGDTGHGSTTPRPSTAPCPSDDDVVRPGGLAAMRLAYQGSAACVASRLGGDPRQWRRLAE
nr:hypothetical protein [Acidobacteriota bacterium]